MILQGKYSWEHEINILAYNYGIIYLAIFILLNIMFDISHINIYYYVHYIMLQIPL